MKAYMVLTGNSEIPELMNEVSNKGVFYTYEKAREVADKCENEEKVEIIEVDMYTADDYRNNF